MLKTIVSHRLIGVVFSVMCASWAMADAPAGYYSSCENKGGAALLSALNTKVGPHTVVSYDGLWTLYTTSDVDANGKLWDMYSTKRWTPGREKCGNYKYVGDCINREHSFPKSWFNDAKPMYSDAFHLYPTDGKVNGQRSNFPYGECAGGTTLPSNGGINALGKLGKSTFAGYSGTVFEPVDEYKGDFARSYFYMAAAYNDKISSWHSDMLAGNKYPCFSTWAVNLLLKWHRQDPVSQKELDRQEAVYASQKNRNPFIDHPEMVEYIWGDKKTGAWTSSASSEPELTLPVNGSTVSMGSCGVGVARSIKVAVKGSSLKDAVNVSVSGSGFSVSPTSLSAVNVNSADGVMVTVTYTAPKAGNATGVLTVRSGSLTNTVTLTATGYDGLPASAPTNISDESFVAHWTNIGDTDANGCYTLTVLESNGETVDTYPRSVKAADEAYLVDELVASTSYSYYLTTASGIKSNVIDLTTAAPVPSIQFLYDGDLYLTAEPGMPSEAYEIILDVENVSEDITLSVTAPFQLSSDKNNWSESVIVSPQEDRFFLRLNSDSEGSYTSTIKAVAGEYTTDDAEVSGMVSLSPTFFEDFEKEAPGGYNTSGGTVKGTFSDWYVFEAGVYGVKNEAYEGSNYLRTSKKATSYAYTLSPKRNGVGVVTFYAAPWATTESGKLDVQTSTDGGETWTTAGTVNVESATAKEYKKYTVTANVSGDVHLRFQQTSGGRLLIDNVEASDFRSAIDGVESDYHSWTAYSLNGRLVVDLAQDSQVAVHGVDGITYFRGTMHAGTNELNLMKGLYVIVVDDFTRRVFVK